jgi:hypothetical protein
MSIVRTKHWTAAGWLAAAGLLAGCGEAAQPLDPAYSADPAFAVGNMPLDISGDWLLESENLIHLTEAAAPIFGFEPEGPRTTIRCTQTDRVLTIVQDGASFSGSHTGVSTCVSKGGQVVSGPSGGMVVGGELRGRSLHFTILDGPVECHSRAAITAAEDGVALVKSGAHQCLEPGHPQSAWPEDPPRWGPNRTVWTAYRLP